MSEYWIKGVQCRTSRGRIYVRLNFRRWSCWYTKSSYFRFGCKTGVEIGQAYWKRLRNAVRGICSLVGWWNFKNYCISARPSLWPSIRKQSWFCQNRVMTVSLGQDRIDPAYRFFLCLAPLLYSSQVLVRAALLLFFCFSPGSLKGTCMKIFLAYSGIEGSLRHQYNASYLYLSKFLWTKDAFVATETIM